MIDAARCVPPFVAFALVLHGGAARGQTPGPSPVRLTLEEAIDRGLAASHRLADAAARRDAADARVQQQRAASLPRLAAQAGYTRTNHVDVFGVALPGRPLEIIYPDIPDNYRTRLDLRWPIYTAGRTDALERAARAEAEGSAADLASARADLRLEITRAYWALVTAGESARVMDESVRRMDAQLADVRNRFDAGLVPPNDVSSVEAQRSRQRMLAIQAHTTRDVAEADLVRVTGLDPGAAIEPAATLAPPPEPAAAVEALVAEARASRPERAALVARLDAASDRVNAARAGARPVINLAGGVDYARPNPRIFPRTPDFRESWDASVDLTWSIFDGGRVKADVAEAAAGRRSAEARLADFDAALAADVRQRASELVASHAAIDAADAAVRAAGDARRVVGNRFDAGVATSTDVLDAQVALLQAQLDRTQAIASARLAEARLARAVGR